MKLTNEKDSMVCLLGLQSREEMFLVFRAKGDLISITL